MDFENTAPSLEEEINAAIGATEASRDASEIDEEINEIRERFDLGSKYLSEKEQEGKLQIMPDEITADEMEVILAFSESLADGTGAQYSTVMPSIESGVEGSTKPALESLKELLSELLRAAAGLLELLWDKITEYWNLFLVRVNGMLNMAKTIRRQAEEKLGASTPLTKLQLKDARFSHHLRYKGKLPGNYQTLKQHYLQFKDDTLSILNVWCKMVIEKGSEAIQDLSRVDENNLVEVLEDQNKIALDLWEKLPKDYEAGYALMGSVSIIRKGEISRSPTTAGIANSIQDFRLALDPDENRTVADKISFQPMRPDEIIEIQDLVIELGNEIVSFIKGNKLPALEAKTKSFIRDAKGKLTDTSENDSADQMALRRLIDYPVAYTRWAKSPAMDVSRLMVEVSRTVQMVCNESLKVM